MFQFSFFKFLEDTSHFCGATDTRFVFVITSGFQSQSEQPYLCFAEASMLHIP